MIKFYYFNNRKRKTISACHNIGKEYAKNTNTLKFNAIQKYKVFGNEHFVYGAFQMRTHRGHFSSEPTVQTFLNGKWR